VGKRGSKLLSFEHVMRAVLKSSPLAWRALDNTLVGFVAATTSAASLLLHVSRTAQNTLSASLQHAMLFVVTLSAMRCTQAACSPCRALGVLCLHNSNSSVLTT
jgi:hypothetical protein